MTTEPRFWCVVPAAGSGSRMAAGTPKQYLRLGGAAILQHTLEALLVMPELDGITVALAAGDERWSALPAAGDPRVRTTVGGAERADSVLACLRALADDAAQEDWVLVHDAARPCVSIEELTNLVTSLKQDPVGGLLALPVSETVKRADAEQRVAATVDRDRLWLAQTPQMFRFGLLREALGSALAAGRTVTDEASAMEQAGHAPRLVAGSATNIKITRPADLAVAEAFLVARDARADRQ